MIYIHNVNREPSRWRACVAVDNEKCVPFAPSLLAHARLAPCPHHIGERQCCKAARVARGTALCMRSLMAAPVSPCASKPQTQPAPEPGRDNGRSTHRGRIRHSWPQALLAVLLCFLLPLAVRGHALSSMAIMKLDSIDPLVRTAPCWTQTGAETWHCAARSGCSSGRSAPSPLPWLHALLLLCRELQAHFSRAAV